MISDILVEGRGSILTEMKLSVIDSIHKTIHPPQITSTEGLCTNNATTFHMCRTQSSCPTQHQCRPVRSSHNKLHHPVSVCLFW